MRKIYVLLGLLFIFNGCSGQSVPSSRAKTVAANFAKDVVPADLSKYSQATFAAGCFWHEETLFESIKGVVAVVSGYAGGTTSKPTYEVVTTGKTGHAETVNIYYDSSKISYPTLLKIYFEAQDDPTQVNGQGPDMGTEYRSIIFYRNNAERGMAEKLIAQLNRSGKYKKPIAAQVVPFTVFWKAEDYHQGYVNTHTDESYVKNVSIHSVARFQAANPGMIKPGHNFVTGE
jgi:peptide-methionine (S)-S-oxide reductase